MLIFEIILKDAFFSDLLLQMKTKVEESNFQQNWICNLTSHEYHLAVSRQGWALNSLSPHHASYKGCQTQPAGFIPFLSEQLHGTLFVFSLSCSSIWLKFLSLITHPSASSFFFAPYCIPACYITVHIKIETEYDCANEEVYIAKTDMFFFLNSLKSVNHMQVFLLRLEYTAHSFLPDSDPVQSHFDFWVKVSESSVTGVADLSCSGPL